MSSCCYSTTVRWIARRSGSAVSAATVRTGPGGGAAAAPLALATPTAAGYPFSGQICWMSTRKNKNKRTNKAISGNRGSRGHGWYVKYREGRGGRHLQGEYWDRMEHHWDMQQWNDAVLSLGSQHVYLDIAVEPPTTTTAAAAMSEEEAPNKKENEEGAADGDTDNAAEVEQAQQQQSTEVNKEEQPQKQSTEVEPLSTERLVIQIASTVMPETCLNFVGLCQEAAYKGTTMYRIEKEVGICGGDVLTNTGKTGQCLQNWPYESSNRPTPDMNPLRRDLPPPEEEPMALWHTAGTVTMLCRKVNEIDSRFILCGNDAPHLDGIHRAFGKLVPESLTLVQEWQNSILTSYGQPKSVTLRIVGCGVLDNYTSSTEAASSGAKAELETATTTTG